MENILNTLKSPSRRELSKILVKTLVTSPLAVSMSACGGASNQNQQSPQGEGRNGPMMSECEEAGGTGGEEHFPPIGVGQGSFQLELKRELPANPSGPPYVYRENLEQANSYGHIEEVRVITEMMDHPYIKDVRYSGLPRGSQLLIWYQFIGSENPPHDCTYRPIAIDPENPDARITGNPFTITVKRRLENKESSHKCGRPFRYRLREQGQERHFRIGRWALVDSGNRIISDGTNNFEGQGDEAYTIYISCLHYGR